MWVLLGLPLVCLLAVLASFISNLSLPRGSALVDRLSAQDKAQIAEFYHLKAGLGNEVWPGFGAQGGPVIFITRILPFWSAYKTRRTAG